MVRREKKKRTTVWLTAFIAFLMIMSIVGIFADQISSGYRVGKRKFEERPDGLYTKVGSQWLRFSYFPFQLTGIPLDPHAIVILNSSRMILLSFEPGPAGELVRFELDNDLPTVFGIYVSDGLLTKNASYDLPVIGCQNATAAVPVLIIRQGANTSITTVDRCIILESEEQAFLMAKDRLLYGMLGIINVTST